jgi:nucleoside 2-deoxyribosyltransferase
MRIYVASSWRNERQPKVVEILRMQGHEVYDFRNPAPGNGGFHWSEIDPNWQQWTPQEYLAALEHPIACAGYKLDMDALESADACVLVMPCGRSAHLEAGYAIGAGKPTAILVTDGEPELMYKMARTFPNIWDIVDWLRECCHYKTKDGFNVATHNWCTHTAIDASRSQAG